MHIVSLGCEMIIGRLHKVTFVQVDYGDSNFNIHCHFFSALDSEMSD